MFVTMIHVIINHVALLPRELRLQLQLQQVLYLLACYSLSNL